MSHKFLSHGEEKERESCRSDSRPVTRHDLLMTELRLEIIILATFRELERQIKMTREEALAAIAALKATVTDIGTGVTKVGTETDTLILKIADLTTAINNAPVPQEVADALADVQSQANTVKAAVTAVDDKVPDSQ